MAVLILPSGTKIWHRNENLHREDGPAVEFFNGTKVWWIKGIRHRTDGPAKESQYEEEWWVNGRKIDIQPILERFDISPDWRNWTDAEKMIVRLAL